MQLLLYDNERGAIVADRNEHDQPFFRIDPREQQLFRVFVLFKQYGVGDLDNVDE